MQRQLPLTLCALLVLVLPLTANPPRRAGPSGYHGAVRTYGSERRPGVPVAGAVLRFTDLQSGEVHAFSSDPQGNYTASVPPGRYGFEVEHPDHQHWRVGSLTVGSGSLALRNVFLWPLEPATAARGVFPRGGRRDGVPRLPLVEIGVDRQRVRLHEPVRVALRATTDTPLKRLILGCDGCPLALHGREHPSGLVRNFFCEGKDPCQGEMEVRFRREGRFVLFANAVTRARDGDRSLPFVRIDVLPEDSPLDAEPAGVPEAPDPAPEASPRPAPAPTRRAPQASGSPPGSWMR